MTVGHVQGDALTGHLLGGRYRLDGLIGRGGMANVYRATDEVLDRGVAVKLFGEASDGDKHASRAAMEVRLLAALNHPSLVTLYDARVVADQDAFLVMELVDGPTLRDRIAGGPIGRVDVAAMAGDLAEALHAVHEAGMVHRDVKPSNVLLAPSISPTREFRAKLADFGIAHLVDSARLTTPGTIMGTAAYLSPEQTRGVAPAPAGDVYSLGLVLLESFTRERAFPGNMAESLVARVQRDPTIPGDIGYAWKSLLTAMTSRTPEDRPTALEVAASARGILSTEGTGPIVSDATAALPTTGAGVQAVTLDPTSAMESTAAAPVDSITQRIVLADDSNSVEPPLAANRRTRRAVGRTASSRPRRSRRVVGAIAIAAVTLALGAGLTSWVVADRSATSTATDGLTLGVLLTSIDTVSSGVSTLVSDRQTSATPDAVPATDTDPDTDGTDTGTDTTSPSETDGTEPAPSAPTPTSPDDTAPDDTVPDETTPDETTPPEDTPSEIPDPEPFAPGNPGNGNSGNGNGNPGNGNGNGPGNNSGKGNG
ncbi:serine/threonine protein kinase [Labedella endophytica]|uniref:non-specific serine/threonine protein kinase n=1 Tax=Labedella endophytica TaxID=1523160 RepID=A0A3S0XX21_9MICO|nr:serine/threonine protein kinase [Labedella endophytica]RUQ97543.1 serine/threonine protein kinase [Labedella endophytica]